MIVKVTQEDIDNGEAASCSRCPIALAVARACELGADDTVEVTKTLGIKVRTLRGTRTYSLTSSARKFISKFDMREEVQPFEFEAVRKVRVNPPNYF